jgi:predicted O-methyltransferase YrrM
MLYSIQAYIKFLKASTNQHGVHSPFVYDLVTKCFYDKSKYNEYSILKQYRQSLSQNFNRISISDFGSGSKVFKSNERVISKMAKTSGISSKRAKLLFRMVSYFNTKSILELGTSLGLASSALSLGNKQASITTIEGCQETAKIAQEQFRTFQLNNIQVIVDTFEKALPELVSNQCNLVYVDGNHTKEATLNYFELLLPTTTNNSVFIFDDIHWSKGMTEAWDEIKNHPAVTVSIDTFYWGIVFFRKEQAKEHFVIRV